MNKSKQEKIDLVKDLMKELGVTPQEMISALNEEMRRTRLKPRLIKGDSVCVGMYWYYDNTFSFDIIPDKMIKAVIEYIDDEYIYGDLTASPAINEIECAFEKNKLLNSLGIKEFIECLPYTCDDKEEIICYSYSQTEYLSNTYDMVKASLERIGKLPRKEDLKYSYWTTDTDGNYRRVFSFDSRRHTRHWMSKGSTAYYRPVLRMKYN